MLARILFIDDDPLTLALLTKAAEMFGHQAILAHSGTEALNVAGTHTPDIIFIDRLLADMDGLAVIQSLHSLACAAATPIVMLSAGQEKDIQEAALSAGAVAFVHKPIRIQSFQELICQYTHER